MALKREEEDELKITFESIITDSAYKNIGWLLYRISQWLLVNKIREEADIDNPPLHLAPHTPTRAITTLPSQISILLSNLSRCNLKACVFEIICYVM